MSQRSQKQKDADLSAKEDQTYSTRNEEGDKVGKVVDIRYPDSGPNLAHNPAAGEPTVAPTTPEEGSDAKKPPYENGFVGGPGVSGATGSPETDARRDARPDQRPKQVDEEQSDEK